MGGCCLWVGDGCLWWGIVVCEWQVVNCGENLLFVDGGWLFVVGCCCLWVGSSVGGCSWSPVCEGVVVHRGLLSSTCGMLSFVGLLLLAMGGVWSSVDRLLSSMGAGL